MKMLLPLALVVASSFLSYSEEKKPVPETAVPKPKESEMVLIPGGEFVMGLEKNESKYVDNIAHKVYVDSFYIDKTEVTNAQYDEFMKAPGHAQPQFWGIKELRSGMDFPNHPVIGLSWTDAKEYAEWRGARLPTEAEWECAARGKLIGKIWPNGDTLDSKMANFNKNEKGTVAVGSYSPNGFGLFDMAGNVREWVSDRYEKDYYTTSPYKNPTGPEVAKFRVIRGGGWHSGESCLTVAGREALKSSWVDIAVGFRCAKSIVAAQTQK